MVRYEQVKNGIARYADREIINKLPDGTLKKILIGSAVAIAIKIADDAVKPYLNSEIASQVHLVDGDMIDVDIMKEVLKSQISEHGLKISLPGGIDLSFRPDDIDTIYRDIQEA